MNLDLQNTPENTDWRAKYFELNDKYHTALLEIIDYKAALQKISPHDFTRNL